MSATGGADGAATGPAGPLAGYRVLDLTVAAAGPYATSMLAEQGADVIKVERPGGDFMRSIGTVHRGVSGVFAGFNHNKRCLGLDLAHPVAGAVLERLVAGSDVLVHNLRAGAARRLGVDETGIRRIRPDIVHASITGWGEIGPRADHPAYDSVMQAAAGVAAHQGGLPAGEPQFVRNTICDKSTGLAAAQLITAALLARERTGEGQTVRLSMLHASLAFLWPDGMQDATFVERDDPGGARATPPPVHRTADGWIAISVLLDGEFQALCRILGLAELADDERFAERGERSRHAAAMWAVIDPVLLDQPTAELAAALDSAGVPNAVVREPAHVHEDPQVVANDLLTEVDHAQAGRLRVPRPLGSGPGRTHPPLQPAPGLGEHTDEVLAEIGFGAAERDGLRAAGVVH